METIILYEIDEQTSLIEHKTKKSQYKRIGMFAGVIIFHLFLITYSIITIIIAESWPVSCNYMNEMNISISQYLIGSGISGLIFNIFLALIFVMILIQVIDPNIAQRITIWTITIHFIFSIAWFIVGAEMRPNNECIKEIPGKIIFALIVWCMNVFYIFLYMIGLILYSMVLIYWCHLYY